MNEPASLNTQLLDALLLDYAAGSLSRPLEILVETHLAMNEGSARTMRLLMQIGGVLLEDSEPVSLSEGALEAVMSAIDAEESKIDPVSEIRIETAASVLPRPAADYLPERGCTKSWRRIGLGIFECDISFGAEQGQAKCYRIAPGRAVPAHSHTGAEVTLILAGGFSDETGSYGPGDIAIQEAGSSHQPVADNDGECLVFAVNEGDIKLTGPLGRVLSLLTP